MINLRRILVPTDFSVFSRKALTYAAAFAEKFGAEIVLLHAYQELAAIPPEAVTVGPALLPQPDMTAAVQAALEREVREAKIGTLPRKLEAVDGPPYEEIVRYAAENDVDLIILGTHGRGWLAHVLLGSVAEKVVRKAPCPVLTVRDPEHEFVQP